MGDRKPTRVHLFVLDFKPPLLTKELYWNEEMTDRGNGESRKAGLDLHRQYFIVAVALLEFVNKIGIFWKLSLIY